MCYYMPPCLRCARVWLWPAHRVGLTSYTEGSSLPVCNLPVSGADSGRDPGGPGSEPRDWMVRSAWHGTDLRDLWEAAIAGQSGELLPSPHTSKLEAQSSDGPGRGGRSAAACDGMCLLPQGGKGQEANLRLIAVCSLGTVSRAGRVRPARSLSWGAPVGGDGAARSADRGHTRPRPPRVPAHAIPRQAAPQSTQSDSARHSGCIAFRR